VSALTGALARSVRAPHWSPYSMATRHCVWLGEDSDGYVVHCLPHGEIGRRPTHLEALLLGYAHDEENGTVSW
jgi:hypothetical protein